MEEKDSERFDGVHNAIVLIIDLEVDYSLLMKAYFLRKSCKVYIASTETEALAKLAEITPDVILVDPLVSSDTDHFLVKIKRLAPDARIVVKNTLAGKALTKREKRVAKRLIEGRPVNNNRYLTYLFILIIILVVLQLIFSTR